VFAVVHGAWPRVSPDGVDLAALEADVAAGRADGTVLQEAVERLVADVVAVQVEAGVELVTDGQVRWPDMAMTVVTGLADATGGRHPLLEAWQATASLTDRAVAQAVPGPYSMGRRAADGDDLGEAADIGGSGRPDRTLALADALASEVRALAEAGCPVILVEEPGAVDVGEDEAERALFAEAQRRLLALAPDAHATLVVSGGSAHLAGPHAILGTPYRSFLFDLIDGPDNWYLVRATPGDRGIVCGALRVLEPPTEDQAPLLVWAAGYAASTAARGPSRVGLSNATPLRGVSPATARALVRELGRGARLAAMTPARAVEAGLDPRTFNRPKPGGPKPKPKPGGPKPGGPKPGGPKPKPNPPRGTA
jgi:methionine synthase II (cobalamin-independent)